jgi:hypothetical protein
MERWLRTSLTSPCRTDEQSQLRYRAALEVSGYAVSSAAVDYVAELSPDQRVGGVYSALPLDRLPAPDQRPALAEQVRAAAGPDDRFSEPVHVARPDHQQAGW